MSRGVAGSRRVLQLPLPLWTVDGRGVVPHACPTGQCVHDSPLPVRVGRSRGQYVPDGAARALLASELATC